MDVSKLWEQHKEYVEKILSEAEEQPQILKFIGAMCKYFEQLGSTQAQVDELRILMGMRGFHYGMTMKTKQEKFLDECKKVIFEPGKEACLIIPAVQVHRVKSMINERNGKLRPDSRKAAKNPALGPIVYREIQ